MKTFIYSVVLAGVVAAGGVAYAEHDKNCKNVHGKVTVVTDEGITVNDHLYKVGKSTRILKGDEVVKLDKVSVGDVVCLDTRGKDDIAANSEVASVMVLDAKDASSVPEKQVVREKVVREKEEIREQK